MKKPFITIVIPLRNTELYHRELKRLEDILTSLKRQTIPCDQIEIAISDIDSDPYYQREHKIICDRYDVKYIYTKTEKPWNISRARNIGIKQAKAPYVMTTDVDCIFSPGFIQTALKNMDEKTIIHCRVWELPQGCTMRLDDFMGMKKVSILRGKGGYGSCQIFPKKWSHKVGGFDEEYVTWGAEDKDFFIRAKQSDLRAIWLENEATYFHQWHPQGNRHENSSHLKNNRDRCNLTLAGDLPIKRNPCRGGGKIIKSEIGGTAVLITTFLRDNYLYRCIESIRTYYPKIAIFVGDNGYPSSEKTRFCSKYNCKLFNLLFDLGVAGTRNEILKLIPQEYKYIVIVEDDIVFTEHTNLQVWQKILDAKKEVGIVGGLLKHSPTENQHYEANMWIDGNTHYIEKLTDPMWEAVGDIKYFLCDLILNVFMMRKEVWGEVKWDPQFKTVYEHSDFFLRIKYKTDRSGNPVFEDNKVVLKKNPFRIAYTPDTWMFHKKDIHNSEYQKYRARPMGYQHFKEKWRVGSTDSSFNKVRPVSKKYVDIKDENLGLAILILEKHGCKWWLEAGTCLGAVRNRSFIAYDPDIDIGLPKEHLKLWDVFIKEFKSAGFELYKEWEHEGRKMELSFKRSGIKLDLFFFFRKGEWFWHGAFGPDENGRWGENMIFLPHVFSADLFENLQKMAFRGKRCFVPNPPERYLTERYGSKWIISDPDYKYWRDCRAIDRNFFKKNKTVFIGGVWDFFHYGHLNILEKSKTLGSKLIVGVLTDEATERYKPRPFVPFEQRLKVMKSLKTIDRVIRQNDTDPTDDLKKLGIIPDYLVHGDDWDSCPGEEYVRKCGGKLVILPYTKGISSTLIKKEIRVKTPRPRLRGDVFAVGIKTFLREKTLFKTLGAIEEHFPYPYKLYIADDGTVTDGKAGRYRELEEAGHQIIRLPFDSGISAGRNATVKRVGEKYILIMDDDIRLVDSESLKRMLSVLEEDRSLGLVSGVLEEENGYPYGGEEYCRGLRFEFRDGFLLRWPANSAIHSVNGSSYRTADQVVNFFLARRELFYDILWDGKIKVGWEHIDFFLTLAKTRWKAAVCLDAKAIHAKPEHDFTYNQHRCSMVSQYFLQKHGINGVLNRYQ